ncbi:MAG: class I SAM-dependent methyltransferase, partial [Pyrinomonadaceae bacterium]
VGSGAHGLIFGFAAGLGVGVDPLAVDYKRLFPLLQQRAPTVAAIGEQLPFADAAFDIVLSDNVIDHAERPLQIVAELVRVLKPGGLLYFTVNIHHPLYSLASHAHGAWNALGLKLELSAFADHTVHFTEKQISQAFDKLPLAIVERSATVDQTKAAYRNSKEFDPDTLLKKLFFKNALFELIAIKR